MVVQKTPRILTLKDQPLGREKSIFNVSCFYLGCPELSIDSTRERLIGTHERADISSEKVTGLLGLADALRLQ